MSETPGMDRTQQKARAYAWICYMTGNYALYNSDIWPLWIAIDIYYGHQLPENERCQQQRQHFLDTPPPEPTPPPDGVSVTIAKNGKVAYYRADTWEDAVKLVGPSGGVHE